MMPSCVSWIYKELKKEDNLIGCCEIPKKYLKTNVFINTIHPLVTKKLLIIGRGNCAIINIETIRLIEQIFGQE